MLTTACEAIQLEWENDKKEYNHAYIKRNFGPVYDANSKILILGSFPSTSLANAAWSVDRLISGWTEIIKI